MGLQFEQLHDADSSRIEAILEQFWIPTWGPRIHHDLVKWRYFDRPSGRLTWLALDRGNCVGLIDSFLRPYNLDGRRILIRETCDWFCLPEYRPFGVGLALMRKMMAMDEPILSVGGSNATNEILPRLKWDRLPGSQRFSLPLNLSGAFGGLLRRRHPKHERIVRIFPSSIKIKSPQLVPKPPEGHIEILTGAAAATIPEISSNRTGLVEKLEEADRRWFRAITPEMGHPLELAYYIKDRIVGYSLSIISPSASGHEARILHIEVAAGEEHLLKWVVSEAVVQLAAAGVGVIRYRASSPAKIAAVLAVGFRATEIEPTYWWSKHRGPPPTVIDVDWLRADDALPLDALRSRRLKDVPALHEGGKSGTYG